MSFKVQFSNEQINNIIKLYKEGYSKQQIVKMFGYKSDKRIKDILIQHNICIRNRTYHINEHVFDIIDTIEKAYWLGFIIGSGYINAGRRNQIGVSVKKDDYNHLVKFANFVNMPIKNIKHRNINYDTQMITYHIDIYSKQICQALYDKGIQSGKHGRDNVPIDIPNEFIRDYLRGLIDANGRIYYNSDKNRISIDLASSIKHIEFMQQIFSEKINVQPRAILTDDNKFRTHYTSKKDAVAIIKFLYYDDNIIYLDSKYEIAKQIIQKYDVIVPVKIKPQPKRQKQNINEHIFDEINTADKAYWLGFIVGDGCIVANRNQLSISLGAIDYNHLIKFADFMNLSHNCITKRIGIYNNITYYVYVCRQQVCQALRDKGIESNKSGHEHVPTGIPNEFIRDYLRGLIDADGCIRFYDNDTRMSIDLSNSVENIKFMQNIFLEKLGIKPKSIYDHEHTFRTYYKCKKDVIKIIKFLYYNDNLTYLDRKYELVKRMIKSYDNVL